jgi:hypothetical protein
MPHPEHSSHVSKFVASSFASDWEQRRPLDLPLFCIAFSDSIGKPPALPKDSPSLTVVEIVRALRMDGDKFPLTPALSLRERGSCPLRGDGRAAWGLRSVALAIPSPPGRGLG